MPHERPRAALDLLLKRLKFTPVVAIQGARQTGKSFLAREILTKKVSHSSYVSLDDQAKQVLAQESPQTFIATLADSKPAIIDEAQKSPALFGAIKLIVDKNRRPGSFLLLGSTEFSLLQNIRESLTGRMGKIRLYPMTYWETQGLPNKRARPNRTQTLKFLDSGGMPAIAFVRDSQVRADFFQDWIDLTCQRDIHQFKRLKLDTQLAYSLLKHSSVLEEPTAAALSKATRANAKKVGTHLNALCELFVLNRLDPHPAGTGKSIYLPLDVGIAGHLGASWEKRLQIALINERMANNSYRGGKRHTFQYYRSTGKRVVHLVEEELGGKTRAFQIFEREAVKKPDLLLLSAFQKKVPGAEATLLAPVLEPWKFDGVRVEPWERIFEE
ncbi:AAA family ATPase [Bdellovibrionota bacterium FG-2]